MFNYMNKLSAGFCLSLALASSAEAVLVQVDWRANIPGTATPAPGPGQLSGSLGVFNVTAVGDSFVLPSDGSLNVQAGGFADGFPNGVYPLIRTLGQNTLTLEFLSVGATSADFSVNFVDNNAGLSSTLAFPCTVDGVADDCFVSLFNESNSGTDMASASLAIDGTLSDTNLAAITYSFTVVPVPAAAWLFGSGLLGLVGIARRRKAA